MRRFCDTDPVLRARFVFNALTRPEQLRKAYPEVFSSEPLDQIPLTAPVVIDVDRFILDVCKIENRYCRTTLGYRAGLIARCAIGTWSTDSLARI